MSARPEFSLVTIPFSEQPSKWDAEAATPQLPIKF
jgi:hypothetical protein